MIFHNTSSRRKLERRQRSTGIVFEQLECRTLLAGVTNIGSYAIDNPGNANPSDTEQVAQALASGGRHTPVALPRETANPNLENADAIFVHDEGWLSQENEATLPSDEKNQGGNDDGQNQVPKEETKTDDDDTHVVDAGNELTTGAHPDDGEVKAQPSPATDSPSDTRSASPLINSPAFLDNDTVAKRSLASPEVIAASRLRSDNFEYFASPVHELDANDPSLSSQPLASEIRHDTFMAMTLLQPSLTAQSREDRSERPATSKLGFGENQLPGVGNLPRESPVDSHLVKAMNDASDDLSNETPIRFSSPALVGVTNTAVMSSVATVSHRSGGHLIRMQEVSSDQNLTSIDSMATEDSKRSDPLLPGYQLAVFTFLSAIITARASAHAQVRKQPADDRISTRISPWRHLTSIISARFCLKFLHSDSRRHRSR